MKIDNTRSLHATDTATSAKTTNTAAARPAAITQSVGGGSVSISETSRSLSTASTNSEAPFDAKRVDAIKNAISAGHFKVNPEKVADKILSSASQLLAGS